MFGVDAAVNHVFRRLPLMARSDAWVLYSYGDHCVP